MVKDQRSSKHIDPRFMSTLLLKRIGSAMFAGVNTAKKMLAWTAEGQDRLRSLYDEIALEDDDEAEDSTESEKRQYPIYAIL